MRRRTRIRVKTVEETYKECDKAIPYEIRNNWVEGRVELRFKYFDQVNDIQPNEEGIETIRRQIMKVTQKLKAKAEKEARLKAKMEEAGQAAQVANEDSNPFEQENERGSIFVIKKDLDHVSEEPVEELKDELKEEVQEEIKVE